MKTIKTKIIMILFAVFAGYAGLDYAISYFIVFPGFLELEQDEAIQDSKRIIRAINREIHHLDSLCHDWSAWDETYSFIDSPSDEYIENNLPDSSFFDNQLNLIYICDTRGKIIWSKIYDLTDRKTIDLIDFPKEMFPKVHPLISYDWEGKPLSEVSIAGLFMSNNIPILMASRPILTNDNKGPSRGSVIMGRFLSKEIIKTIVEQTQVDFRAYVIAKDTIPVLLQLIPEQITVRSPHLVKIRGKDFLQVYTTLPDISGKASLLLESTMKRIITGKGADTIRYAYILIILAGITMIIVILLAIQRVVIRPIAELTKNIQVIGQTGDLSKIVTIKKKDEIGILANEFNRLLELLSEKISTSKQTEEVLRENEESFRAIVENSHDGIILIGEDFKFQYVNDEFCRITGQSHEELFGRDFRIVLDGDSKELVADRYKRRQQGQNVPSRYEFNILRKDGAKRRVEISVKVIRDSNGKSKTIAQMLDITENKKAEKEKKRLEAKLRQAQKMEAIGTLAGGIAHDFNNILSAIFGYAQLAQLHSVGNEKVQKYIQQLNASSERAKGLVQQILAFSRQSNVQKKPIDIGVIVKEVLKLLRATIPATIAITHNVESNLGTVMADETQIHQVLMNLCVNASQAMEKEGGQLNVELVPVELGTDEILAFTELDLEPGNYLKLSVSDTGMGMDKKTMSHIFEPYFTTKKISEGTGMGLATVHGIVINHGGDIKAYSKPGSGSTFHVLLPIVGKEMEVVDSNIGNLPMGSEQVLFVDDEKFLVDIGIEMLEDLGYTVEGRTSSHDALEAFRANPDKYDILITDMTMPEMTGEKLAREIKNIRIDIPIIICSGFSKMVTPDNARRIGVNSYLNKPVTMEKMAHAIRKELDEK